MLSPILIIAYVAVPALVMVALALAGCWRFLVALSGVLCLLSLGGLLSSFVLPPETSGLLSLYGFFVLFYSFPTLAFSIMFYFISRPLPRPPLPNHALQRTEAGGGRFPIVGPCVASLCR